MLSVVVVSWPARPPHPTNSSAESRWFNGMANMAFGLTILRFADRYSFRMNQGVAAHEKFNSFAHFQLQGATT